ncbi:MAG: serine/threonine-protein kinase, partial [Woeseia sp.]
MEKNNQEADWSRVKSLFAKVMQQPPEARGAYLAHATAGDDTLRTAVQSLLDSVDTRGVVADVIGAAAADLSDSVRNTHIDHYEIESLIGEGGMGDVFLAHRSDGAFEQKVAIKVVGGRRPGDELIRRFRAERQILASLEHPNIARLIDGGETSEGAPYLVMEYVDGVSITEYCDQQRLGIAERLKLFLKVCAAVQHAHRNLIVHRDIKPNNILVGKDGEPKLLDFGIAKLLDADLLKQTMVMTMASARLMTPRHASPEQVRGDNVTTATDIYSLGTLLYELLSGVFPYEVNTASAAEIERVICDTDPSRPSTRLTQSTDGIDPTTIAEARRLRVAELVRQIGGDLDTIVLKAMQKEPERRYATIREFAEDIRLYLQHRPVLARPDSLFYRGSKFMRRNRVAVTAATAAVAVAITATALSFSRIAEERDLAEAERQKAEAISSFMQQIFEVSDPEESLGEAVSARDLLEEGARRVEFDLADQPETQITMMRVLANVYYSLGDWENASKQANATLQRAESLYGMEHPEVATSKLTLGMIAQDLGRFDESAALLIEGREIREKLHGRQHFDVVEAISLQAFMEESRGNFEAAEVLHVDALDLAREIFNGDDATVAEMMTKLGGFYRILGRTDEAEPLLADALNMQQRVYGGIHPEMSDTKRQMAGLYRDTRRFEEAERLYKEVIAERVRMLGENHTEVAHTWNSYAQLLDSMGEHDRALDAYRTSLDLLEKLHNGPHPSFGALYNNFAVTLKQQDKFDEALEYYQLSLDMQDAAELPARHPNRSFPLGGMANTYLAMGRYAESVELARRTLELRREHFDETHRLISETKNILGAALTGLGEFDEAEQSLLDAYTSFLEAHGERHAGVALAAFNLAELFKARGDAAAEAAWRQKEAGSRAAAKAVEG